MSWSKYGEFLAFAVVLILIPGPDFAVVTKSTLAGGRRRGRWTALRVCAAGRQRPRQHGAERGRVAAGLHLQHHQPEGAGLLLLMRRRVRRALDATTGAVLLGFGARLATEHV